MNLEDIEHFEDYLLEHGVTKFFLFIDSEDGKFGAWLMDGERNRLRLEAEESLPKTKKPRRKTNIK
jgi:hypothetical protein